MTQRERWFTRGACAELLMDAGAVVKPKVCEGLLRSRAKGLLELFQRKGLLPRTLNIFAALGDADAVRGALDEKANDLETVNEAFVCACRFDREAVASLLLERSIALDPELGKHIDGRTDRRSLIRCFNRSNGSDFAQVAAHGLLTVFVMGQVRRALHERKVADFLLERGANINTNWNSHEPASLLHSLVFLSNPYESMQYLLDRGIDMTIKDYRWDSTAVGWARYGNNDEKMAQWLEEAERQREQRAR